MNFGRRQRRAPRIDMSPLIDVVFQLLLFYAVTTQFVAEERLKLQLPEADTAEQEVATERTVPEVLVTSDGAVIINQRRIPPDALEAELRKVLAASPDGAITIRGDRSADYGTVVHVLDVAKSIGAKAINMAAVKPPPKPR